MIAVSGVWYLAGRGLGSGARMIAFPARLEEATVLAALARADIDDAIGSSSALVPLSNFSRILAVTFQNATGRVLPGDPRQTPFLEELSLRFSVPGPDDTPWTVIYLTAPSRTRDVVIARVLTGLSPDWAWDVTGRAVRAVGGSGYLWIIVLPLLWALWLIIHNPRRDRLQRLLLVVSSIPLLLGARPGGSLLFIVLTAALTLAIRYVLSGAASRLAFFLWPYVIATIVVLAYEPASVPFFVVSIAFSIGAAYLSPRLERLADRKRLHATPAFRNLTMNGVHQYARRINRVLVLPVVIMSIIMILAPARRDPEIADAPLFMIEHSAAREHHDANALFEEHLAFQQALTYGRLGDFTLENTSYTPVYRYKEEEGRMMRAEETADAISDWSASAFKAAIKVLSVEGPDSITRL